MLIFFSNPHKYKINKKFLINKLEEFYSTRNEEGLIFIALVDTKEIKRVAKKFLKEDPPTVHNVLSFPEIERKGEFVYPDDRKYWGEILVCYDEAVREANEEEADVDSWIVDLFEHGSFHLFGIHHD